MDKFAVYNKAIRDHLLAQTDLLSELKPETDVQDFFYDALDTIEKVAQYRVRALKSEIRNYFNRGDKLYHSEDIISICTAINSTEAALNRVLWTLDKLEYSVPWTFKQIVEYVLDMA